MLCEARVLLERFILTAKVDWSLRMGGSCERLSRIFRAPSRKSMLQQCSQGTKVIPPNGIPGLKPHNSTSPLVLLRRMSKTSGVLTDVVQEPETLTAAASKKDFCIATSLMKDIAGYIARKALHLSRFQPPHFRAPSTKTTFQSCVRAPSKFYMWVLGRPSN